MLRRRVGSEGGASFICGHLLCQRSGQGLQRSQDTYVDSDGNVKTDTEAIQRSKLRVDTRKWLASKKAPRKYGDKVAIGGADDLGPVQTVTKEITDAERAVRLSRAINDNPAALQALLAAIAKKGAAK